MNLFRRSPKQETVKSIVPPIALSPLHSLFLEDPKMYAALQNFLLSDPERQLQLLDDIPTLLAKGNAAKDQKYDQAARANYETAAKIEIYKQNKESAMSFLVLAEGVSDKDAEHFEYLQTLLANMDKVLRISKAYQGLPLNAK